MATQTKAQLVAALAIAEGKLALMAKPRLPSNSMARAILIAAPGLQKREFCARFPERKYISNLELESWLEELRENIGLV